MEDEALTIKELKKDKQKLESEINEMLNNFLSKYPMIRDFNYINRSPKVCMNGHTISVEWGIEVIF